MNRKVGRMTLAVALIVMGTVLIIDLWSDSQVTWFAARLWPGLLIFLGLEWLAVTARTPSDVRPQVDGGAIALLLIVALIASNAGAERRSPFVRHIPSPPAVPPLPPLFGTASEEIVLTQDGDAAMQELHLDAGGSGEIEVEGGDRFRVELRVRGFGRDREDALQAARMVRLAVEPGAVTRVRAERPGNVRADLSFRVIVPKPAHVNLQTVSGSIKATEIGGNVKASATSGSIEIKDAAGAVSARSSSGGITVDAETMGGDYDLAAVSGSVRVSIPEEAGVTVSARTTSGSISGPVWLTLGEGRGSGTGTRGDGRYRLTISTSSGSVRIGEN